jgi:hypothetical protein
MAGDHNGNSFEMGRLWGLLQAHMEQNTEEWRQNRAVALQQNEILLDIKDSLNDLPSRIATTISTTSASHSRDRSGVLRSIPPILKATAGLLTVIGLMTGRIAWTDIPGVNEVGGMFTTK